NVPATIRTGVARFRLVWKIIFNHFLTEAQTKIYSCTAPHKVKRFRRQIRYISYLVCWQDKGTPQHSACVRGE
ncbi:PIPO, partial [Basella rugose mosaic virus]|uniref:PIPO n=1 Tax=Basella rugose mosaic virus TaxID=373398 RepID=UPI0002651502